MDLDFITKNYYVVYNMLRFINLLTQQIKIVGIGAISIIILGAYFVSIVFTIQIIKELMYFNASSIIGNTLTNIYIKDLTPVVTAIILAGKVASAFTAEIAVMKVTKQLDAMYTMNTNPIYSLVMPRLLACCIILPMLNIIAFLASLSNSLFLSVLFYQIPVVTFFASICWETTITNIYKSLIKSIGFAIIMALISCYFGLQALNTSKGIGQATTSSVVVILILIFISNFILSSLIF